MKQTSLLLILTFFQLSFGNLENIQQQFIDFDLAMQNSKDYNTHLKGNWNTLKSFYKNNLINGTYHSEPIIPKIIHHIWIGSPFPEKLKQFRNSWINNHPDWQFILWTDKEINEFGLINRKLYDETNNYGCKADIARYEILYKFGGLYIDTDFECIKPFDIFHHYLEFYTGISFDRNASFFNGLIGCIPNHPIMAECINKLQSKNGKKENYTQILYRTGPFHFTNCFFDIVHPEDKKIAALPVGYFYPWPHWLRREANPHRWIQEYSYAIHYWHTSWQK